MKCSLKNPNPSSVTNSIMKGFHLTKQVVQHNKSNEIYPLFVLYNSFKYVHWKKANNINNNNNSNNYKLQLLLSNKTGF